MTLKDKVRGTSTILYDAQAAIADIHAPVVENLEVLVLMIVRIFVLPANFVHS